MEACIGKIHIGELMARDAPVPTAGISFGKIPRSVLEKAIDALKERALFRRA